jgi:hypothetical protein
MNNEGASLISSVFGLKDSPRIPIVLPSILASKASMIFFVNLSFCLSLASIDALTIPK